MHVAELGAAAAVEILRRQIDAERVARTLGARNQLNGLGCVELDIAANSREQVGLRAVLREQIIVEVLLLVGEISVAVEIVERKLTDGELPSVAGRGLGVGELLCTTCRRWCSNLSGSIEQLVAEFEREHPGA